VGSIRLDGVRFVAYLEDHEPRHVHGFYAEAEVVMELHDKPQKDVALANRSNAVRPGNANRGDVRHILKIAAAHFDELIRLWEDAHA
jgi:hypothetical protein